MTGVLKVDVSLLSAEAKSQSRLTVVGVNDLEVLDRGLGDTSMEVEHVWLSLFVPAGGFVHQGDQFVGVVVCVADQQGLEFL